MTKDVQQQFGRSLPRDIALSNDPFIAYAMNGEPIPMRHGYPARVVVPALPGVHCTKWVRSITFREA